MFCGLFRSDPEAAEAAVQKPMYYGYASANACGPVSGRRYRFSHLHPVQIVDEHDAVAILKMRLFRQIP